MVGRLLPHQELSGIGGFTESVIRAAPRPWLQPLAADLIPPGGPLLRSLIGHRGPVTSVALTPTPEPILLTSHSGNLGFRQHPRAVLAV